MYFVIWYTIWWTDISICGLQLEENLLRRVTSLVQCSNSDFWRNGRFLVRTNRQLVSHKDGELYLSYLNSTLPLSVDLTILLVSNIISIWEVKFCIDFFDFFFFFNFLFYLIAFPNLQELSVCLSHGEHGVLLSWLLCHLLLLWVGRGPPFSSKVAIWLFPAPSES